MPIITKPSPLEKDATGVFSLDKTALALHPIVVASSHFSSPNVWDKIIVKYKSETLGQFESIEFDATLASPEGQFFVSETAEDIFEIEKITIIDKDGAILLIPRAELTVAEFDIDFSDGIPQPVPIMWLANPAYVLEDDGGATASATRPNYGEYSITYADPSQWVTSDFTLEAVLNYNYNQGQNFIGFYDSTTPAITTAFTGASIFFEQAVVAYYEIPAGLTYTVKIQRIGLNVKFYVNNVEKFSGTHTDINKAKVPFFTFTNSDKYIASATIILPEAPAAQAVTWNVAGKSGVGTVTAGANGLITKATGGAGYNVNVLSNETITGDGYVEFIWSHTNVVFGIAETIHPSGSYTDIVYGGYNAGGGWEIYAPSAINGSGIANNSLTVGDVVKVERVGNLFKAFKNGLLMHTCTVNNLNPLKASICIYSETNGVNGATISL